MKLFFPLFLIVIFFTNCRQETPNTRFYGLMNDYEEKRMALLPEVPYNNVPSILQNPTVERFKSATTYLEEIQNKLSKIAYDELDMENRNSYDLFKQDLNSCLAFVKDDAYLWDPSFYNVGGILKHLTTHPHQDTCSHFLMMNNNFKIIPAYYETAKTNLKKPSIQKTLLAIEKNSAGFHFLKNEVADSLLIPTCERLNQDSLRINLDQSLIAIKDYVAFCNSLKFEYGEKNSELVFRDSL